MTEKPFNLSVKVIIIDAEGRALLLRRSPSSGAHGGKWDMPGGKLDDDEQFYDALVREVREETGLEISVKGVVGHGESESPKARIAYIIFEAAPVGGELRLSDEHDDYMWAYQEKLGEVDACPHFKPFLQYFATHPRR